MSIKHQIAFFILKPIFFYIKFVGTIIQFHKECSDVIVNGLCQVQDLESWTVYSRLHVGPCVVFLVKTLYSQSASLSPSRCILNRYIIEKLLRL